MRKQDLFFGVLVLILVAVGAAGVLAPKRISGLWSSVRELLLPSISEMLPEKPEEQLEIELPEIAFPFKPSESAEQESEKPAGLAEPLEEVASTDGGWLENKPEEKMTLFQIRERIKEVEEETGRIKERVSELVRDSEKKAIAGEVWNSPTDKEVKAAQLTEIQEQLEDISAKIEVISARIVVLTETSGIGT